eukprot:Amastigsp_a508398_29.p5 type:complete len:151 gc:universal Amastigsp_a508398_29:1299-847(-)
MPAAIETAPPRASTLFERLTLVDGAATRKSVARGRRISSRMSRASGARGASTPPSTLLVVRDPRRSSGLSSRSCAAFSNAEWTRSMGRTSGGEISESCEVQVRAEPDTSTSEASTPREQLRGELRHASSMSQPRAVDGKLTIRVVPTSRR